MSSGARTVAATVCGQIPRVMDLLLTPATSCLPDHLWALRWALTVSKTVWDRLVWKAALSQRSRW
jgi:hypothetical protein